MKGREVTVPTPFLFPSLSHHQCQVKIANIYHGHLPSNVSVISAGSGPGVGVGVGRRGDVM